jgi:3-dehydroquinate synthase
VININLSWFVKLILKKYFVKSIKSNNYQIEIGSILNSSFQTLLSNDYNKSKKVIIVDENTKEYCLEYLITSFTELSDAEIIELPSGEENKQLDICIQIWEVFTEYCFDRNILVINLGGGVISDMGGLIASLYKRGVHFVNIPTTLLSMVDASIGGKTGVDLGVYKNQVGLFSFPKRVFIDTIFLTTLEANQIKNGIAEMLKHGLIVDASHWNEVLKCYQSTHSITDDLIYQSVCIKNEIVEKDPLEKNIRKKLNFGHTVGHALESYFLEKENHILHGYGVAVGILIESYISFKLGLLEQGSFYEVRGAIHQIFEKVNFAKEEISKIIEIMRNDKKNENGQIKMILLKSIGICLIDQSVSESQINEALHWYLNDY